MKETDIKAVYSNNLDNILKRVGMYEDFIHGQVHCKYCDRIIDYDNLSLIIPRKSKCDFSLDFCCNSPECLNKYRIENE